MSSLQLFSFNDQSVRVLSIDGDPWFVATDVLNAIKSTTKVSALKAVISDGLGDGFVDSTPMLDSLGRMQDTTIIHEAAVTFLVSRSRTETGKAFNRLLHSEILPTIRKTGKYEVIPTQPALPQSFSEALRLLAAEVEAKEALEKEIKILAPKAEVYDTVMESDTWLDVRELFKCLALPKYKEKDFRKFLCSQDVKILSKDTNQPYSDWVKRGFAKLTPVTLPNGAVYNKPVFSWKGCDRIIQALRGHGVIPANQQIDLNLGYKVVKA